MKGSLIASAVATLSGTAARGGPLDWPMPQASRLLWPAGAPGLLGAAPREEITERSKDNQHKDRAITGIAAPRIDVFPAAKPNGASVLLIPGGGYARIAYDREGYEMAAWFNARGITAFVLFYRLPSEGWADAANVPLADAQRAVRLIRTHASEYAVDPAKLTVMGFSAGGHLCVDLAGRFATSVYAPVDAADTASARPNLVAPIYPVVSMAPPIAHGGSRTNLLGASPTPEAEAAHAADRHISPDTPPCFVVHAMDDPVVPVDNSLLLLAALRKAGVPCEAHLFEKGGHGFAMRNAVGLPAHVWPELFMNWAAPKLGLQRAGIQAGPVGSKRLYVRMNS